jgi:DNA-directed RNA polymerase subunit beta
LYGQGTKEYSIVSKLSSKDLKILSLKLSRSLMISTTSFDGASSNDNYDQMELANINWNSQSMVLDSRSGERFDRYVTVGLMYILKLNHLVDEKIHARFTGPYNRVTEQPLGGKSLEGGQRFGEMEVWALQAYGAAYTLFDMLTVKSDLKSRLNYSKKDKRNTDNIDKRKQSFTDFPEAFNVLLRELWCLGLNIKLNN